MKTSLAWFNLFHRKMRTATALAGVGMAILLMFIQYGFYRAACHASVMLLEQFDYDAVLVSSQYVMLGDAGSIARERIYQALAVPGVIQAASIDVALASWRVPATGSLQEIVVVGVRPEDQPFRIGSTNVLLTRVSEEDTGMVDLKRGPGYDSFIAGSVCELNGRQIEIVGQYTHGFGFIGNAGIIVSDRTFLHLFRMFPVHHASIGILKLEPGADATRVVADLNALLPDDVQVVTRARHFDREQQFIMNEKPVGIIFTTGLWMAFAVGAVILYQILSAQVVNHLSEYATLKAMGYGPGHVNGVVWQQAILFVLFGYFPALVASCLVYHIIDSTTNLPTRPNLETAIMVFLLSLVMCTCSAFLAVRKVHRADPADLF